MMSNNRRRQTSKKRRITSALEVRHTPSDIELHLIAQRQKHENRLLEGGKSAAPVSKIAGFEYNSTLDRYYPICSSSSSLLRSGDGGNNASAINQTREVSLPITRLLSRRSEASLGNFQLCNYSMHTNFLATSLHLEPMYSECSDVEDIDHFSDTDLAYDQTFGVARTSAQSVTIYNPTDNSGTSIDLSSFTRLRGSSNPQWRPSHVQNSSARPTLAVLVHSESFAQTVLLQQNAESIRSSSSSGPYQSSWKANKIGGLSSKDQGSVSKIGWSNTGSELFLLCETGIWMNSIERNLTNYNIGSTSTSQEVPLNSSTMILSTRQQNDYNTNCSAVAICNTKSHESVKFVGFRNGDVSVLDTRERTKSSTVGRLPYCVDYLDCLRDEITLVVQDITGHVSLYDCRMPSSDKNTEYMRVVTGNSTNVRKTRRFWVSPDEGFLVVPANESRFNGVVSLRNDIGSGLAAYNLRFSDLTAHDHVSSSTPHHHHRDKWISFLDLKVPNDHQLACRRYGAFPKSFVVVPSTVKLPSCSGGHDISTISDDIFPGLYCVANVVHSDQRKVDNGSAHNQAAAGSALFKAKCSRSNS
jgi:hypothetical protein